MQDLTDVSSQAGEWDARLRSPDCTDAERARFEVWRDADSRHRLEFERLQALVSLLRSEQSRADVRGLSDAAMASAHRRSWWRSARRVAAGVATLAVGVALWGVLAMLSGRFDGYATDVGQRSTLTLQDGSSIELNARSRVKVQFDASRRLVKLMEGQALFHVARDPKKPFVVRAGGRDIVALGTAFDVRIDESSVRVTLLEGKVAVDHSEPDGSSPQVLLPGQQLVVAQTVQRQQTAQRQEGSVWMGPAAAAETVRQVDVARVTSWRQGRVFLEDLPLDEAIVEMNRYSPVQIVMRDASLRTLRVNGMFRAGEQDALVAALQEYFPMIVADHLSPSEIVLRRRQQ